MPNGRCGCAADIRRESQKGNKDAVKHGLYTAEALTRRRAASRDFSADAGHRKKPLIARTLQAEQKRMVCQQLRNRRLYVGGSRYEVGQIFLSLWS